MRYIFILGSFFLSICHAQFATTSSTERRFELQAESEFKVLNSRKGYLYLGIDNLISIPEKYKNINNIEVTTNNGDIFQDSSNYVIIPDRLPKATIYIKEPGMTDEYLDMQTFVVQYVPQPCITLGGECVDEMRVIDRHYLLSHDTLGVFISDDVIGSENWVTIRRFTVGYVTGSVFRSFNNEGNRFSAETKEMIKRIRPGQEISIRVTVVSEGDVIRHIPVIKSIIM